MAKISAPAAWATCRAASPTPPVAAWMRTRSPEHNRARWSSAYSAVTKAHRIVEAASASIPLGTGAARRAEVVTCDARAPAAIPSTGSPGAKPSTPSPQATTVPAQSMPSSPRPKVPSVARGESRPMASITSRKFKLAAWTSISISPGPGGRRVERARASVSRAPGVPIATRNGSSPVRGSFGTWSAARLSRGTRRRRRIRR